MSSKKAPKDNQIAVNKKARHDYFIEERFEAGIMLEGWEVKSIRQSKVQLIDSYILLKDGEAYLFGGLITPLLSASTHVRTDARRTRKLLLKAKELAHLFRSVDRAGYTLVPLSMYWKGCWVKVEVALAKGKQEHDKRATEKEREWNLDKQRIVRAHNK